MATSNTSQQNMEVIDMGYLCFGEPGVKGVPCVVVGGVSFEEKHHPLLYRAEVMLSTVNGTLTPHRVVAGMTCMIGNEELEIPYYDIQASDYNPPSDNSLPIARWAPAFSNETYEIASIVYTRAQCLQHFHHRRTGEPERNIGELKRTLKVEEGFAERIKAAQEAIEKGECGPGSVVYGGIVGNDDGLGVPSGVMPISSAPGIRVRNEVKYTAASLPMKGQGEKKSRSKAGRGRRHRRTKSEGWEHLGRRHSADRKRFAKFFLPAVEALRRKQIADGQDPNELWYGEPLWAPFADEKGAPAEWEDTDEDVHNESM
ncbi:hypothetical protein B0A48_17796 [Cryoendolithus antarcticus]|uniref:Uncharacterized protein n=1 Tax=Cryoendolithus antarcticus TaxID=1507870 RepID=A0A1V8SAK2_9PEZI|nr:hypothetical protein B0A48_17796 [Cryoendolithus antarcticus]